jgi:phosphopantetheinyl transferase (holo-ACP synthase)
MGIRTGVDSVDVNRFRRLLEKYGNQLTEEFFTDLEREEADRSGRRAHSYACYWALREAGYKVGNGSLWNDYTVDPRSSCRLIVSSNIYDSSSCDVPSEATWSSAVTMRGDLVVATVLALW